MQVSSGATATLTESLIEDNQNTGVVTSGPSDENIAVGVVRASITGERVAVTRNQTVGIFGSSYDLQFTDLVMRNTQEKPESGEGGDGIQINSGTTLTVDRALVDSNREYGVIIDGSMATLRDVAIRGTQDRVATGSSAEA